MLQVTRGLFIPLAIFVLPAPPSFLLWNPRITPLVFFTALPGIFNSEKEGFSLTQLFAALAETIGNLGGISCLKGGYQWPTNIRQRKIFQVKFSRFL